MVVVRLVIWRIHCGAALCARKIAIPVIVVLNFARRTVQTFPRFPSRFKIKRHRMRKIILIATKYSLEVLFCQNKVYCKTQQQKVMFLQCKKLHFSLKYQAHYYFLLKMCNFQVILFSYPFLIFRYSLHVL